jgi:hypothetical protein
MLPLVVLLTIQPIFGPETPTGRYKHPASITTLRNGDLYLAYYGGTGEYAVDTGVFGSRLAKGQTRWTPPKSIPECWERCRVAGAGRSRVAVLCRSVWPDVVHIAHSGESLAR